MADMLKPTEERLLVCVSPSPSSARLINSAKRMATSLHAKWFAVYVEQPKIAMLPEAERSRAADNLRLAGQLGGETVTLAGRNIPEEIVNFARQRNVTRIIVGKPRRSFWKGILSGSPVDQLVRTSGEIDVYVITGEPGETREAAYVIRPKRIQLSDYGTGVLYLILATAICFLMYPYFHLSNLIMVYLLGVMLTATGCGRGPAILMSLLSVLGLMAISLRTMERQYATGHLSLVRGKGTTKGIDIGMTATIGAAAGSTLGLTKDRTIGLQHAEVIQEDGEYIIEDKGAATLRGIDGRKAVIVLTDGIANRGALDIDRAIAAAVKDNVSVYVIGLGKDVRAARLERIAGETGGTYFFTPAPDGLRRIYETISSRIRNEYVVTFDTEKRSEYLRTVEFGLSTGQQATRRYFQPASSLFGSGARPPAWAFTMPFLSLLGIAAASFRKVERQYRTGHLSIVRGRGTTKDIDIGKTVTIGLDGRRTVGLFKDGGRVPQHAEVVQENGQYVIEDKGVATGTFVNKQKVTGRQTLRDGDVIDVGNATIVFSEPAWKTCPGCGEALRPGAKFCPKCGAKTL